MLLLFIFPLLSLYFKYICISQGKYLKLLNIYQFNLFIKLIQWNQKEGVTAATFANYIRNLLLNEHKNGWKKVTNSTIEIR
jgi:hypothetical protein